MLVRSRRVRAAELAKRLRHAASFGIDELSERDACMSELLTEAADTLEKIVECPECVERRKRF
jgi:hypothetical protein